MRPLTRGDKILQMSVALNEAQADNNIKSKTFEDAPVPLATLRTRTRRKKEPDFVYEQSPRRTRAVKCTVSSTTVAGGLATTPKTKVRRWLFSNEGSALTPKSSSDVPAVAALAISDLWNLEIVNSLTGNYVLFIEKPGFNVIFLDPHFSQEPA